MFIDYRPVNMNLWILPLATLAFRFAAQLKYTPVTGHPITECRDDNFCVLITVLQLVKLQLVIVVKRLM
jgi:hypothetical protein